MVASTDKLCDTHKCFGRSQEVRIAEAKLRYHFDQWPEVAHSVETIHTLGWLGKVRVVIRVYAMIFNQSKQVDKQLGICCIGKKLGKSISKM